MQVIMPGDENVTEEAASVSSEVALFLELWRADLLLAVAEVVEGCSVVRAEPSAGLVFGTSSQALLSGSLMR